MSHLNRRRFLQISLGASAALAACSPDGTSSNSLGSGSPAAAGGDPASAPVGEPGRLIDDRAKSRVLVMIDLDGGNDGPSTVVPASDPIYHDLRPNNAIAEGEVLTLGAGVGLNPNLKRLHRRGLAYVEGVGPKLGDLSHFEMGDRWARGDVDGTVRQRDGFLARVTRTLGPDQPLTGVSLNGTVPHFFGPGSSSLSLGYPGDLWFLSENDWDETALFAETLWSMHGEKLGSLAGQSYETLHTVSDSLAKVEDDESVGERFDGTGNLGEQLQVAGTIIQAGLGTKVFFTGISGFDTHEDHRNRHDYLMEDVDASVAAFLDWMDDIGRGDDVVVATMSEFGRRVAENESGLDHGSASTMLIAGAGTTGAYGEASPLEGLDEDGNLVTTVGFDRYLATLAEEWLGVEASSVLPGTPETLGLW